ncbi:MAG: ABC transporter transmembrane domain-containing protein [Peptostreptococcaceae bacterium]|nr:ABC transporter transmembrane domain-containing protein [Peptostreptococcaceae bacterium]
MTAEDILILAKKIDLKAKIATLETKYIKQLPMPSIIEMKNGDFCILAHIDEKNALILRKSDQAPVAIPTAEFETIWSGKIILIAQKFWKDKNRAFGFRWFIPDIIKYKKPLIEVLVAALTIQILGLFSPIITQVVIDKVLTHHSFTTLNVMSAGLFIIVIFETVMGIARNYLFTHTTSRIDVMLGARLFDHLFSLPFTYFETRRVGDTIARVRELENIRQFLTGTPLTIVLDVAFVIVYIAVMFIYSRSLTMLVLFSLPIFALLSLIVTPLFKERLDEKFNCGAEQNSYLVESVTGVQTVKSFALEPQIRKKWEGILSNYVRASFKTSILAGTAGNIGQFIQKTFDILILWMGAHLVISGQMSVGQLVAFRMLSGRVSGPVLRMVQMWQDFQQAALSVRRLGDIFNTCPDPTWLRRQIGVVLQENFLFNASVRDNICIHKPTASMDEIIRVAKIAGAHEFILELSEGYNTMVGEKGTGLSGGQKQRIAIARALLHDPRILIFDEATSALDYESESIIQKNLKEICRGRTVMIIAHRLSTLKDADLIMAIDRGEVVEFGTRAELIANRGLFYYLNAQQESGEPC